MVKHSLWLPDGSVLSSGTVGQAAIREVTVTETVSDSRELTPGAVCAAVLEMTVYAPAGFSVAAGQEVALFRDGAAAGIFLAETPVRQSADLYKLTAYDRVSLLDRDLGSWLESLTGWPYALYDLACMVCDACGVTLVTEQLPNGSYPVQKFSAPGITGRQLLQWAAQAAGCFCRANAEGQLEFGWYTPADIHITPGGENYYYQGSLTREDYTVTPVEQIRLRKTEEDVGTVYPQLENANTLAITGNYLLSAHSGDALAAVAETLYGRLRELVYTPCTVTVPASAGLQPGHIFTVTDALGVTFTALAMEVVRTGGRCSVKCTGSRRRDSTSAVNDRSYRALSGKVLNLRTDVDGIKAENADAAGRAASLSLTVEGLAAQVKCQSADTQGLQETVTGLQQTSQGLSLAVQDIRDNGVSRVQTQTGYVFDSQGLTISRAGQSMENRLDNTGMYVTRAGQTLLQANDDGVAAADVQVHNYLCIGENARFEDYEGSRTACFYIGG